MWFLTSPNQLIFFLARIRHNAHSRENNGQFYDLFPSSVLFKNVDFSVHCSFKHMNIVTDGSVWSFTLDICQSSIESSFFCTRTRILSGVNSARHLGPLDELRFGASKRKYSREGKESSKLKRASVEVERILPSSLSIGNHQYQSCILTGQNPQHPGPNPSYCITY